MTQTKENLDDTSIFGEQQIESEQPAELLLSADSKRTPTLSVVLPTLNEEAGIGECIENINTAISELEITAEIIVCDNSVDKTPEIASQMGAIVVTPDQLGYGYAYQYGFQFARGEYIAIGDADTTYDFQELPKLMDLVVEGDADIALGNRLGGEIKPGAMPPLHQYLGNPILTKFLNVFYDAGVTDAHSGFRVLSRDAVNQLELQAAGMEFASEMIMDAANKGLKIEEVPITYHERKGNATLDTFRDGWRHVKFMLINAPGYLFSVPAVLCAATGIILMGFSIFDVRPMGVIIGPNLMVAGSLLTVCGFQIGTLAVFSSVASSPIRKPQDSFSKLIRREFRLEHGATIGLCVFLSGGLLASYLLWLWGTQGSAILPELRLTILAFTAIVLGLQTVFSSFFFSAIVD